MSEDPDYLAEIYGQMGKSDMKLILDLMGDVEAMFGDAATISEHLRPLVAIGDQSGHHGGMTDVPGLVSLDIDSRADKPSMVMFYMMFAGAEDRDRFRAGLDTALGAPDPACSNDAVAHWAISPDRSAVWRSYDYASAEAYLEFHGRDPEDANCVRSISPKSHLTEAPELEAYFARLLLDPPPIRDTEAFLTWARPYGEAVISGGEGCDVRVQVPGYEVEKPSVSHLGGIRMLEATVEPCADGNPYANTLAISSYYAADLFGMDKARAEATKLFGPPHALCTDDYAAVWAVDAGNSLMVIETNRSFGAVYYPIPLQEMGCEIEALD